MNEPIVRRQNDAGQSMRRPVVIVSTVLPRWIADFNAVTTWLCRCGYPTTVYVPASDPRSRTGWRSADVIRIARRKLPAGVRLGFLPYASNQIGARAAVRSLLMALRIGFRNRPAVVFLWQAVSIVLFGPVFRVLRLPTIYMITGLGWLFSEDAEGTWQRSIAGPIYRFLFSGGHFRVLVHNSEDKAFLCARFQIEPERIHVTPGCGVDPAEFPFDRDLPRNEPPVILVPVRLLVQKGLFEAAEASRLLACRGVQHEMWFTSNLDESQPSSLTREDLARINRQCSCVRFKGYQTSLVDFYRRADIVCVPTYYREGLPTALLEAASIGRPIVTCDNVGSRDFIRDGIDGLLVPPKSSTALADGLERLLRNLGEADAMRMNAHRRFLNGFTKQHMLDVTAVAFRELVGAAPACAPASAARRRG